MSRSSCTICVIQICASKFARATSESTCLLVVAVALARLYDHEDSRAIAAALSRSQGNGVSDALCR